MCVEHDRTGERAAAAAAERATAQHGRQIGAAALLLAGSVLLSRVLGFVREMVLAAQIGVGPETDAYYAARTPAGDRNLGWAAESAGTA